MVTVAEVMRSDYLEMDAQSTISEALGKLLESNERYVLVTDKRFRPAYKGVLDRTLLIESKLDANAQISTFVAHPPVITEDTDVFKAAELLYHSYPALLPVRRKDRIVGVIYPQDVLQLIPKNSELARIRVSEVATKKPIVFQQSGRLGDALNIMRENHFSHIPIVDSSGRIISVFSLTDLFEKHLLSPIEKLKGPTKDTRKFSPKSFAPIRTRIMDTNIGDAASINVFTVSPTTNLGRAIGEMAEHKISDLIVTQDRKPVGIVTERDLLGVFAEAKKPEYWGIQFFGCEALPEILYRSVREQVAELYEKIQRAYFPGHVVYFMVHIKKYEKKEHGKEKYSVHLRLATVGPVFNSEYAHFHLNTAVSWALRALEREILKFKERGKKSWTITGKKGKRIEFGIARKRAIEQRGKFIRPKLVKRK